jgi:glycyl-tRNA synthetase alpha subunit
MSKDFENNYKLGLYLLTENSKPVYERIFSADQFNPVTRYAVNVKDYMKQVIKQLQGILSSQKTEAVIYGKNIFTERRKIVDSKMYKNLIDGIIKNNSIGEFKIGLYINNNPIIEREFSVYNYNSKTRLSGELMECLNDVTQEIEEVIKESDQNRMWEDYIIISKYNMDIKEVRNLSIQDRSKYLKRIV